MPYWLCLTGYALLAILMAVDSSITPVIMNCAANDDFYGSLSSALECAV